MDPGKVDERMYRVEERGVPVVSEHPTKGYPPIHCIPIDLSLVTQRGDCLPFRFVK